MAQVSIAALNARQLEGAAGTTRAFTFRITRIGGSLSAGDVNWTVAEAPSLGTTSIDIDDFAELPSGTTSFALGQTEAELTILFAGDNAAEFNERFVVQLSAVPSGDTVDTGFAFGIIMSDDTSLSIGALEASRGEGSSGTTDFTFMVYRNGAAPGTQTVDWAVAGAALPGMLAADAADFAGATLPSGTVTFAPSEFRKPITVTIAADSAAELHEGFTVTLSNPSEGAAIGRVSAEGRILNDDGARYSVAAPQSSIGEGTGANTDVTFTITRTGTQQDAQVIDWNVTPGGRAGTVGIKGDDISAVGSLTPLPSGSVDFLPGETSKTITLTITGDAADELNESFTMGISSSSSGATIGRASATMAIIDDDGEIVASGGGLTLGTVGDDVFLIGSGVQQVLGLGGVDRFILNANLLADAQADIAAIGDFDAAGGELIDLSRFDAIAATEANDAFAFIGTAAFSGTAGELSVTDTGDGLQMVVGDVNGDAVGDFAVLLLLPPEAQASWFVL